MGKKKDVRMENITTIFKEVKDEDLLREVVYDSIFCILNHEKVETKEDRRNKIFGVS